MFTDPKQLYQKDSCRDMAFICLLCCNDGHCEEAAQLSVCSSPNILCLDVVRQKVTEQSEETICSETSNFNSETLTDVIFIYVL